MKFEALLEIHFHDQDLVSVILETTGGPDEQFGEHSLFALYACRQMANLGEGREGALLSEMLFSMAGGVADLIGHRNPNGARLVPFMGQKGRRRFEAKVGLFGERFFFQMNPKGFGWLGRGLGYYSPTSVLLFLQYLAERRLHDEDYLRGLTRVAFECGAAHKRGVLTIQSQADVAFSAARTGLTAQVEGNPVLASSIHRERLRRRMGLQGPAREEAKELDAYDSGTVALVRRYGHALSLGDWALLFDGSHAGPTFKDFSDAMKAAFHSVAVSETSLLVSERPELAAIDFDTLRRDVGGHILNGYLIGRSLLGTRSDDLAFGTATGPTMAESVLGRTAEVPACLLLEGGDGLVDFLDKYVEHVPGGGTYQRMREREHGSSLAVRAITRGFTLAIGEWQVVCASQT